MPVQDETREVRLKRVGKLLACIGNSVWNGRYKIGSCFLLRITQRETLYYSDRNQRWESQRIARQVEKRVRAANLLKQELDLLALHVLDAVILPWDMYDVFDRPAAYRLDSIQIQSLRHIEGTARALGIIGDTAE